LLGFWGEWHTFGNDFLPEYVQDEVVQWYDAAFATTPIQIRNARLASQKAKMGYHDDSFTYSTLDGPANGGYIRDWFFWNRVALINETEFWRHGVMGELFRRLVCQNIMVSKRKLLNRHFLIAT
jgi:hypothetical protein